MDRISPSNRSTRNKTQRLSTTADERDATLKKEMETERARSAAKTARLRALRLAKEDADKVEAARLASERPAVAVRSRSAKSR